MGLILYDIFYGLKAKPFRYIPGTPCFFLSKSHKKALQHLRSGLTKAEGFIVLTGVEGTGKSVLFSLLAKELVEQKVLLAEIHNTEQAEKALIPSILSAFKQTGPELDKQQLISRLLVFFTRAVKKGKRCVIMVDAANHFSNRSLEELRLLTELRYQDKSLLQVVLVGDECLEKQLSEESNTRLRQNIVGQHQIESMRQHDAKQYILYRLKCVGWKGSPQIQESVFDRVYELTEGIPANINRFCDRLLMQSMMHEKQLIDTYDIEMLLLQKDKPMPLNNTYTSYTQKPSGLDDVIIEPVNITESQPGDEQLKKYYFSDSLLRNRFYTLNVSAWKNKQIVKTLFVAYCVSMIVAFSIYYFS